MSSRIVHIAETELLKFFPHVEHADDTLDVYNLRVSFDSYVFCVVVMANAQKECLLESPYMQQIMQLQKDNVAAQYPIIVIDCDENTSQLRWGILCFWEYDQCRVCRHVDLKVFNEKSVGWIKAFVSNQNKSLSFLPLDKLYVIKTINLNDERFMDAQLVYFRQFTNQYKMHSKLYMNEREILNHLITGTPENEYPHDKLDEILLSEIIKEYPNAKAKSSLLVFNHDILALQLYADKERSQRHLYLSSSNGRRIDLELDILYYKPFWGRAKMNADPIFSSIDAKSFDLCSDLKQTYRSYQKIFT